MKINRNSKIFLAGHNGMLGQSILRILKKKGYKKIITINKNNLDLRNQNRVEKFFKKSKPDVVLLAAAKVGGIKANMKFPVGFIKDNLQIQTNIISSSFEQKVKKLVLFGSSCIFPSNIKKPIKEKQLMSGNLEKTNESYAIAKLAGVQMIKAYNYQFGTDYICLMPCNLFGPNDNYDLNNSHFIPALIRKIFISSNKKIKSVKLWGTGKPLREVLYVDEVAKACEFFMKKKTSRTVINIGSDIEMSISEYANIIKNKIDPRISIEFDKNKEIDGVKRKKLDISLAKKFGWKSKMNFNLVLDKTIEDYKKNYLKK
jgi:GDP-L-fucose synthase